MTQRQQVFQSLGVQRQIDAIHVLAPEGRIHDGRRQRVGDRIAHDSVDARSDIHLIDAVDAAQFLRGDLSRSGFFARHWRRQR